MFYKPIITHNLLLTDMRVLGFLLNLEGLCLGVAHMATQAILLDDLETFDKRLSAIAEIMPGELVKTIELCRQEYNKRKKINGPISEDLKNNS